MVVLRWHANAFTGMAEFEPDDRGYAAFETLIRTEVKKPLKLLIDIIEEDIRLDTAPHLIGRDRQALHKRLVNRYFRQYSHKNLHVQGRESEGRRDDIVLLTALTNSKLFQPWLTVLERCKTPLQGIYSLPLAGQALVKTLRATDQNALVISQQVPSSIRQSFYARGKLKLSRLVPSGDDNARNHEVLRDEINRTVRYLENQHYVDTKRKLHIYVIAPGTEHKELQSVLKPDTRKEYHVLDRDRLAFELGIKNILPGKHSHWLFAHLVLNNKKRRPDYVNHADQRYYYHHQARMGMYALSAAAIIGALLWGVAQLFDGYLMHVQGEQKQSEQNAYQQQYEEIVKDIAELDLNVEDVRGAVNLAEELQQRYNSSPLDFFVPISNTLSSHPDIDIRKMQWIQTNNRGHSFGESKEQLNPMMMRIIQAGRVAYIYRKGLIEATVVDYDENPRIALEKMNEFIDDLRSRQNEYKIEVVKMPFDIDPASRLVGQALAGSNRQQDAQFAFVMSKEIQL